MKVNLIFNLPEDEDDYKITQRASEYFDFLWELAMDVRGWLKYGHNFKNADEVLEEIRNRLAKVPIWDIE